MTRTGKLLLTSYHNQMFSLLYSNDRLMKADRIFEAEASIIDNIYIGRVQSISLNLQAAFIEIQKGLVCYLPLSDSVYAIYTKSNNDDKLQVGDELLVQVTRDAVKTKQPMVSTKLSLSGNYLSLCSDGNSISFSKKLEASVKKEIRSFLSENPFPECKRSYRMIIRTNAGSLTDYSVLTLEGQKLVNEFQKLITSAVFRTCPSCLVQSENVYVKAIMKYYESEYDEIITDSVEIAEILKDTYPNKKVRFYEDTYPLNKLYCIDKNIENALNKKVWLKSGGYLIIEPTEALTTIDVNSGKYESKKTNEESFLLINSEACEEIALQLRLRNLSGIIIIDFINMKEEKHQIQILQTLKKFVQFDSISTQVIDMTPLGLVEVTRKRVDKPLYEQI